jgi:hypothetical protein
MKPQPKLSLTEIVVIIGWDSKKLKSIVFSLSFKPRPKFCSDIRSK